jgi:hypothetical protein
MLIAMMDLRNFMKRMEYTNKERCAREKYTVICPGVRGVFLDTNGDAILPLSDIIEEKEFNMVDSKYSMVVPGIMEWYERYQQYVKNPTDDFDWKSWHRDGLIFTRHIYNNLPRNIPLKYIPPMMDNSNIVKSFDVTDEKINSFIDLLGESQQERYPVIKDVIAVGVKIEDEEIYIRFKVKGKFASYTLQVNYDQLEQLKIFMESIAVSEEEPSAWESYETGMYFYPQTIGGLKNMGQLHIFSNRRLVFYAYVNSRELIRSVYRSIMTYIGSTSDDISYKGFQSELLEYYIDDKRYERLSFIGNIKRYADLLRKAFGGIKSYFREIYESILNEDGTI